MPDDPAPHPHEAGDLRRRGRAAVEHLGRDDALWPGQLAIVAALVLLGFMPDSLTIAPNWIVPAAEAAVLAALVFASRTGRPSPRRRDWSIALILLAAAANLVSLGLLVDSLVAAEQPGGSELLLGGVLIWATNLVLFAVVYWELDRGGPIAEPHRRPIRPDLLFPQMTDDRYAEPGWKPRFGDYLYVSLTNQAAFSPTDTLPLTRRIKALMGLQSVAALVTLGVIVARAVNNLT